VITIQKSRLTGSLDDLQRTVEYLARDQGPQEYLASTRLRELAVALATQADLHVSAVTYADGSQELEVVLTDHPSCDPIVIGRDHLGGQGQLTWERWLSIEDQPGIETVVYLIKAVLNAARPDPERVRIARADENDVLDRSGRQPADRP
jgi:hypothetical protein